MTYTFVGVNVTNKNGEVFTISSYAEDEAITDTLAELRTRVAEAGLTSVSPVMPVSSGYGFEEGIEVRRIDCVVRAMHKNKDQQKNGDLYTPVLHMYEPWNQERTAPIWKTITVYLNNDEDIAAFDAVSPVPFAKLVDSGRTYDIALERDPNNQDEYEIYLPSPIYVRIRRIKTDEGKNKLIHRGYANEEEYQAYRRYRRQQQT